MSRGSGEEVNVNNNNAMLASIMIVNRSSSSVQFKNAFVKRSDGLTASRGRGEPASDPRRPSRVVFVAEAGPLLCILVVISPTSNNQFKNPLHLVSVIVNAFPSLSRRVPLAD